MKVASSLLTLKSRDRNCQVVRRRGRLYVINKKNPRFKARLARSDAPRQTRCFIDRQNNAGIPAVFYWMC